MMKIDDPVSSYQTARVTQLNRVLYRPIASSVRSAPDVSFRRHSWLDDSVYKCRY